MAGVTNTVFRRLCRAHGADVLTSEFVLRGRHLPSQCRTREYVEFQPDERPVGVQLFGADPDTSERPRDRSSSGSNPISSISTSAAR